MNAETKHTPGPWTPEADAARGAWIQGSDGGWAALACGHDDETARANARLIAAAPDLFDALKWVDENAPQNKPSDTFTEVIFRRGSELYGEDHDVLKSVFDDGVVYGLWLAAEQVRAALSKAGG